MPDSPNKRPATVRQAARDLKVEEGKQASALADLAKGRANLTRGRVAIARGRATLVRRARAGEPDSTLAPIRANFDAAEADLNVAEAKLDAAAARIELAEHRLAEARDKARSADRSRLDRSS
jgi:hypothetical protein